MPSFEDYRDDKGRIDWGAYHKAEVLVGERCDKCGGYILFAKGYRTICRACQDMAGKKEEVTHDHYIRCPKCGHISSVHDDCYGLFEDGEHDVSCQECEHDYVVSTHVEFHFISPPRLPEEKEVEEEDDDNDDVDETSEATP
jgi:DNA-directed RNA polymerase subunit RPC12/RpoP